jgi:ABC-type Zn uptake system ZnuABC Zn-binding protein ZnuA
VTLRLRTCSALLAAGLVLAGAACSGASGGTVQARLPALRVVTGLYPLAQAIQQIGQSAVSVTDIVPSGSDPRSYHLTALQVAEVRAAPLVVVVGGGFQPSLEAAADGAPHVLRLGPALATADPYVWLDTDLMQRAVTLMGAAMQRANPPAGGKYRAGAAAFASSIESTGIDYQSTLSVCPRRTIVTPDAAFAGMARQVGLTDQVVGTSISPDPAHVKAQAAAATAADVTTAFAQPFVTDATVRAVAQSAGLKIRTLDPLTGPPPGGWPRQANYLRLMEANLGTLSAALGCPDSSTGLS